jgi:glycosyltransferase involved in cell wall biosynthesis
MVNLILKRQPIHDDYGATAKDTGLSMARGEYVCFFDDDNIYYPNAISTMYSTVMGHDIGICRVHYKDTIIPPRVGQWGTGSIIESGKIDSMCFAIRTSLAKQFKWAGGGRFSDIRYLEKVKLLSCDIKFNDLIIGEHL